MEHNHSSHKICQALAERVAGDAQEWDAECCDVGPGRKRDGEEE